MAALVARGLGEPAGWERCLRQDAGERGRGSTSRIALDDGAAVRIKRLRRGGALGRTGFDRFFGSHRLLDNVRIPELAVARGIATPRAVALLLVPGPPGWFRGFLGTEEIRLATDLRRLLQGGSLPARAELVRVVRLIRRMHDVGLEHRDLHVANVLLAGEPAGERQAFVVDLDGARLSPGPLGFRRRQRGLRRFERSWVKWSGGGPEIASLCDDLYRIYGEEDAELARRLEQGRRAGRAWIRLHALGWKR
jgi:hypothetical protein